MNWMNKFGRKLVERKQVGQKLGARLQCPVLGSVLFIIYITVAQICYNVLKMNNFAGDTTVFSADNNIQSLFVSINQQMSNLGRSNVKSWLLEVRT